MSCKLVRTDCQKRANYNVSKGAMYICYVPFQTSALYCRSVKFAFKTEEMSGYKLYYFDSRGRAETSRLSFAAAGIEFEDVRMTHDEWAKKKACE